MPPGPDRRHLVRHMFTVFNNILHYINNDEDGPQAKEIIWILEKLRRSVTLYFVYKKKKDRELLRSEIDQIFDSINSIVKLVFYDSPSFGATIHRSSNELRKMARDK